MTLIQKFTKTIARQNFHNIIRCKNTTSKSSSGDCGGKKFDPCSSPCGGDKPSICKEPTTKKEPKTKKEPCKGSSENKDACKSYFSKVSGSSKSGKEVPCVCGASGAPASGADTPKKGQDHPCDPTSPSYKCPICNPSAPSLYDCRKYGHKLPNNDVTMFFEPLPQIPTGVFRCTTDEVLGPCAQKCGYYQQPEYFSYHHMTYYDMHLVMRCYRNPSPKTGRKP